MILEQVVVWLVLLSLTTINYLVFRDALYPGFLQGIVWLFVFTAYLLYQDIFIPLSTHTYFVVAIGPLAFTIGSLISCYGYTPRKQAFYSLRLRHGEKLLTILFWLPLLGFPIYAAAAYKLGTSGPFEDFYINLRFLLASEETKIGIGALAYLGTIGLASAALSLVFHTSKIRMTLSIAVALGYAALSGGRSPLFLIAATLFGILAVSRRIGTAKAVVGFTLIAVSSFVVIGYLLGKGASAEADLWENALSISENFREYLLSPLPAFSEFVRAQTGLAYGENVFRFFLVVLKQIGLEANPPQLVQPITEVPVPTNVYTLYQPYYADFAIAGVVIGSLLIGVFHGYIYRRADLGFPLFIFLYGLFTYPLLMQPFQDQYFNLLSTWVQLMAIGGTLLLVQIVGSEWARARHQ